jgi:ABC-2 type transport system ATP-binding protein
MSTIVLETQGLTKRYKQTKALDSVSVRIEKGRLYGFVGQNGAGKTTFLRLVAGLSFPTNGDITLFGQRDERGRTRARRRVGSIIEMPALYPNMTARQNLEIYQIGAGIPDKAVIEDVLVQVGLANTGKKKTKNFSLGMKQRLAIAIALLNEPELLLLDEPINGLDPISIVEIRDLLTKLCKEQGITILISSHILSELHQMATDYIFISRGRIIEKLSHDQLDGKCLRYISIGTDNATLAAAVLERDVGTQNYTVMPDGHIRLYDHLDDVETVSRALAAGGLALTRIAVEGENLESYFVNLVGGGTNV